MLNTTTLLFLIFLTSLPAFADDSSAVAVTDSILTTPDSSMTFSADSLYVEGQLDSLERMSSPSLVGTYDRHLEPAQIITQDDKHWMDYRYLGGLLESMPGVFIRDQASEGQYNELTIRGMDWRSIAFTLDGRPLNDPASGIYNMYHFATEYADRIEFISGPRAFLYGLNSTGGAVNLVTKNYNSNRPLSRLNYSESGYNYSYTDGTFSQNISRKINVTLGFQQQSTDGRFENSGHEAWNARVKLRYNVSRDINIILSDYYTHTQTEMNGGVISSLSRFTQAFDPLQATMVNTDSYEKINRHDVDLSFVGTLLGDTSNVTMLTLYYSNNLREYRDEENRSGANGIFIQSDHRSSWMGAHFTQNFDSERQRFNLGANLEIRQIEGSPNLGRRRNVIGAVWAKEEILLGRRLTFAAYGRYDKYIGNQSYFGFGSDLTVALQGGVNVFLGASSSHRLSDSREAEPYFEVGASINTPDVLTAQITYFYRDLSSRYYTWDDTTSFSDRNIGVELKATLRFWVIEVEGTGMFLRSIDDEDVRMQDYPEFSGNGGIYYRSKLINDNLDLKVGFKGRFLSSHTGKVFSPEMLEYNPNTGSALGLGSSVDFVLMAHIGSAYIHFIWENLTNAKYYITPYYPVLDREIRLGLSWQFLD